MDDDDTFVICPTCCGDGEVETTGGGWMNCPACAGTGEKPPALTSRANPDREEANDGR